MIPYRDERPEYFPKWTALRSAWRRDRSLCKLLSIEIKQTPTLIGNYTKYITFGWITIDEYYRLCVTAVSLNETQLKTICDDMASYDTPMEKFSADQWCQLALLAISEDAHAGLLVERKLGKNYWSKHHEQWNKICFAMIKRNGVNIEHIINPSIELQHAAVDETPWAVKYIENPSADLIVKAASLDARIIVTKKKQYQTREVCLAAFGQTQQIYGYIVEFDTRRYVLSVNLAPKLASLQQLQLSPLLRVEIAAACEELIMKDSYARLYEEIAFHQLWALVALIDRVAKLTN